MTEVKNLKQTFLTWYLTLSESEQKLLKIAGAFFVIFLLYFTVNTISTGVAEAERKLQQQKQLNTWALQQIAIINSAGKSSASNSSSQRSMTQIINSTARRLNITIERLQPQKDDLVKVGIDEIGFNVLILWLHELASSHNIVAKNVDFSESNTTGLVNIRRLDLERI